MPKIVAKIVQTSVPSLDNRLVRFTAILLSQGETETEEASFTLEPEEASRLGAELKRAGDKISANEAESQEDRLREMREHRASRSDS